MVEDPGSNYRGLAATSVAGGGARKENHQGNGFGTEYLPYEIISATTVKIFSADLNLNGRARSTYTLLSHKTASHLALIDSVWMTAAQYGYKKHTPDVGVQQ